MHLSGAFLTSAFTAGSVAGSFLTSRDRKPIGRFTLPLEKRAQGDEAVAPIYGGVDWVTSVGLGGQNLRVQIDTGSADLYAHGHNA